MTALRTVLAAALLVAGAAGLTGCGGHTGSAASEGAGVGASQDLQGIQSTLDDIDQEIAGDPR